MSTTTSAKAAAATGNFLDERISASRVLTTITVGRACWATDSGRTPKSAPSDCATSVGVIADAPITTSCVSSAWRMIAAPTLWPSARSGRAGSPPPGFWGPRTGG